MPVPVLDMVPSILPGVERALVDWLPKQRWFGGRGRPIQCVELTVVAEFALRRDRQGPCGLLAVADVHFVGPTGSERYQVPLGLCRTPPPSVEPLTVTTVDGVAVSDATALPELNAELLGLIARNKVIGSVRFASEPTGELAFAHRGGLRSRRSAAEQSNTSVLFGDRFIMKLFRRLPSGVNPDLEVHRGLSRSGSRHIAPLLGAIEGDLNGLPVTYAMLQSFASDSTDGWDLATDEVRAVVAGGAPLFAAEARLLGGAVAGVHRDLAGEFGVVRLSATDMRRLRDGMLAKLDAAVAVVPALRTYAEFLRPAFTAVGDLPAGQSAQRIHGDLHLGQVLRTPARWLLVDFEGEPALPLADRVAFQLPLRDVAGMLRSFDYAAAHGVRSAERPTSNAADLAAAWSVLMRDEFCLGYAAVAGTDPRDAGLLLRAYELEKLVYEAAYETRNRPTWARIPLRALRLLTTN
ncbi:MAG TPA: aminoglycoside phosphotransferase [Pseudonocardiaceae bacterium]|nr:aminoglycoside phosphotransferase [Pseudonocardiaceae bacterium]